MSCSRALVLMAMVNRMCATRSWVEGQEETSEKAGWGLLTRSVPPRGSSGTLSSPTLVHRGGAMLQASGRE